MTIYALHPPSPPSVVPIYVIPTEPMPLVKSQINLESTLLSVKIMLLWAKTHYSQSPLYVELSPQDVEKLAKETGDGTKVYDAEHYPCPIHVLSTLAPGYIKFILPLPKQEEGVKLE